MLEQQLIDYIKKAREAGQTDEQTKALLYKNGWTTVEVGDALAALSQSPVTQPQVQAQAQAQARVQEQSQVQIQKQAQPQQAVQSQQPQVQPQIASTAKTENIQQARFGYGRLVKLGIILAGFAVVIALVFFVLQYFNISLNLFQEKPAAVIGKMLVAMNNVKSSHIIIQNETTIGDLGKLSLAIAGDQDILDANNPKGNVTISGTFGQESASGSMIFSGNTYYLKLDNSIVWDSILPGFKNKWFKIDQESIKALSQASGSQYAMPDISSVNTPEFNKNIIDLLGDSNLFSSVKQLKEEVVSGQSTYHYLVTISKDKLKGLVSQIIASQIQEQVPTLGVYINSIIDAIGDINIELWVGKGDYMLYQYRIDKTLDLNKISPNANMQIAFKLSATSSNFNKPVTVQVPQDAQKIENFAIPYIKLQNIKNNMSQIGSIAETISGNYSSLCSRGLLNGYLATYGTNLVDLHKNIIAQGGKKPVCFANIQNYCVSTQLTDGSYQCIGVNKILGTTKCISAATACK